MICSCRRCLGVIKEIGKIRGFEIHWLDDILYLWRGHRNQFTRYVNREFWAIDDWIFSSCFRSCLTELQQRPICHFVKWVNTHDDEFLCNLLTIITIQVICTFCVPHQDIDCKRESNVEKCMRNFLMYLTGSARSNSDSHMSDFVK